MRRHPWSALAGRCALVAASVHLLASRPLPAQIVTGTVTDALSGAPVHGAVVTLTERAGNAGVRRTISDRDGTFAVGAPAAGSYALDVRAIGFTPWIDSTIALGAGESRVEQVALKPFTVRLATVRVQGRSACRRTGDLDVVTTEVWDNVWAALASTEIAHAQQVQADVFMYTREYDAESGVVLYEDHNTLQVRDERPFRTAPPAELARYGYWRQTLGGQINYYGPDAQVLMSPEFLASHCFSLVRDDSAAAPRIGLTFRPTRGNTNDVEGVLWIDAFSGELRELEYAYTGLQPLRGRRAEGRISFSRLPNGVWVDDRWLIRHPLQQDGSRPPREARSLEMREGGGFVLTTLSRQDHFVTAVGHIRDGVNRPARGATVEIIGTDKRVLVDDEGAFRIDTILAGTYEIRVMRAGSAEAGGFVQRGTVTFESGGATRVDVGIPDAGHMAADLCEGKARGDGVPLYGVLRDIHSGRPVANYGMEVGWSTLLYSSAATPVRRRAGGVTVTSDWRGAFLVCNVTPGSDVRFRAAGAKEEDWSQFLPVGSQLFVIEIAVDSAARGSSGGGTSADSDARRDPIEKQAVEMQRPRHAPGPPDEPSPPVRGNRVAVPGDLPAPARRRSRDHS
jgi:Carboxypeptidase regulatory-like domain